MIKTPSITVMVFLLFGCATSNDQSTSAEKQSAFVSNDKFQAAFNDNLGSYVSNDSDGKVILKKLHAFKQALLNRSVQGMSNHIDARFEQREIDAKGDYSIKRDGHTFDFAFSKNHFTSIDYRIIKITGEIPQGNKNAVVAVSYHGKHFTQRFLEIFSFSYDGAVGKIERQTRTRLYMKQSTGLEVGIHILERRRATQGYIRQEFKRLATLHGPDGVIDTWNKNRGGAGILSRNRWRTILFVFRDAPPVGSQIEIEHSWLSPVVRHPSPKKFKYTVKESNPFYMIHNVGQVGCCVGDTVTFKVFLDNHLIGERSVRVVK